jgi:hypothetical protein
VQRYSDQKQENGRRRSIGGLRVTRPENPPSGGASVTDAASPILCPNCPYMMLFVEQFGGHFCTKCGAWVLDAPDNPPSPSSGVAS